MKQKKLENFYTLEKIDGRKSKVQETDHGETFDGGSYGSVNEINIALSGKEKSRNISLAVKNFKQSSWAENAHWKYRKLKEAGIKVPPTYRIDRKNQRIFMTDYNKDGKIALSASTNNKEADDLSIAEISNLEELKIDLENECHKAAANGIIFPLDSFFFIVPRQGENVKMDFVIGDLDEVYFYSGDKTKLDQESFYESNIQNAESALDVVMKQFIRATKQNHRIKLRLNSGERE